MPIIIQCSKCNNFFTKETKEVPNGAIVICPKCKTEFEVEDTGEFIANR